MTVRDQDLKMLYPLVRDGATHRAAADLGRAFIAWRRAVAVDRFGRDRHAGVGIE